MGDRIGKERNDCLGFMNTGLRVFCLSNTGK